MKDGEQMISSHLEAGGLVIGWILGQRDLTQQF
jgi:hypothetical protein